MSGEISDIQLNKLSVSDTHSIPKEKPVIIGIYGVPGCGKTFVLNQLKERLGSNFQCYDGSEVISSVVPGNLEAFQQMDEDNKKYWREYAIGTVARECDSYQRTAIVAGHFMFWDETDKVGKTVYTQRDLEIFTHIIYLTAPADILVTRRTNDTKRVRSWASQTHLAKWQQAEKDQLRQLCRVHGILFIAIGPTTPVDRVLTFINDFREHNELHNVSRAAKRLDGVIAQTTDALKTMVVLDADKTLAPEDTGKMFWEMAAKLPSFSLQPRPLNALFNGPLQYSYTAFRQASLLYEEVADDDRFEGLCEEVASAVTVYSHFISLLQLIEERKSIGVVVITSGLQRVWVKVLQKTGLSEKVKVIGGGRISDGIVINAAVKEKLVHRLRNFHLLQVWAFGDGPLDLDMLRAANQATVVVGEEQDRSRSMESALLYAIENQQLSAGQTLLPHSVSPRLDTSRLPVVDLTSQEVVHSILQRSAQDTDLKIVHATEKPAAKILMTTTRDATVAGPALRQAHRNVGWYLATEHLTDLLGVEEYPVPHVQGHHATGYRLRHERKSLVVALMRGGEPMAFGVNDAFPLAMFLHAKNPEDVKREHLQDTVTVLLVDSVVNNGKTVVEFVEHIRALHASVRIVVVTGVAQSGAVAEGGLVHGLARHGNLRVVALRLSENKFRGRGGTDTGHRLFNTTHLP